MSDVLLAPCGEGALRVTAVHADPEQRWRCVHHIADWLNAHQIPGVYGSLPTYDSLLIEFDPVLVTAASLGPVIDAASAADARPARRPRRFVLPMVYGGSHGPDLEFVADFLGLTQAEVVDLHSGADSTVRCLGGPIASCMLDGPAFSRPIPRLADPRLEVPENAISVAGEQGVVGPVRAPSGWRLIGLTPVKIMDVEADELIPYLPGDRIRFRPIDSSAWSDYEGVRLHELAEAC